MGSLFSRFRGDEYEGKVFTIHGRSYVFHKKLGKGGFGAVYSATRQDGLPVAVKVINLQGLPPQELQNLAISYLNEVDLLNQLRKQTKHVVKIHDFDFEFATGRGFIVMELGNENLSALIDNLRALGGGSSAAIDYTMVQAFWRQIVSIIRVIHSRSIVHMDLKPENLILFGETLKIGDLGISKKASSFSRARYGTWQFSAPEIMLDYSADHGQYGPKADIWSLGAILYFMVYGVPPDYFANPPSRPPLGQYPHSSVEINDALRRTLVLDPNRRADINTLMQHPLTHDY